MTTPWYSHPDEVLRSRIENEEGVSELVGSDFQCYVKEARYGGAHAVCELKKRKSYNYTPHPTPSQTRYTGRKEEKPVKMVISRAGVESKTFLSVLFI